jgi:hypothetical protein
MATFIFGIFVFLGWWRFLGSRGLDADGGVVVKGKGGLATEAQRHGDTEKRRNEKRRNEEAQERRSSGTEEFGKRRAGF